MKDNNKIILELKEEIKKRENLIYFLIFKIVLLTGFIFYALWR